MYEDLGDKLSAMYEAKSLQLIDQMYLEEEELSDEDIKEIEFARGEIAYYDRLNKQEYDRCVCYK